MNRAQQRYVASWIGAAVLITVAFLESEWLSANWHALRWPLLALLMIAAALSPKLPSWRERSAAVANAVRDHPFIGPWLVFCCLVIAIGIYWVLSSQIDLTKELGPGRISVLLLLLILIFTAPLWIVMTINEYKARGAQSNPTAESGARKSSARGSP